MKITVIGTNHKTAPIDIREKFYLNQTQQDLLLAELKNSPKIAEAIVISTCNRTEIYLHAIEPIDVEFIVRLIMNIKELTFQSALKKFFYCYEDREALKHLLHVACGLDSLVLGEKQILGQVKTAFMRSQERGFLLKPFNVLANLTVRTGKKVRTDTEIDFGGSSVSWAAIAQAEKVLGSLSGATALVIGAGKMSKLAVGQIVNKGFEKLYLMNRTHENAQALAEQFNGEAVPFCDIKEILAQVDLCICSSSAPHYILDFETVNKCMPSRKKKPLLFIDISMPRNIDPKVADIKGVELYFIDDLDAVVEANMKKRQNAVAAVEAIVEAKLSQFYQKLTKFQSQEYVAQEEVLNT
ncbi:MAG TPA: glutamyl-tRNA reductase [Candidatus Omnitrophota bacterium]|nr:glutamyl-tRNA reductase [Candidatus Omnitrophota bacterium]